MLEVRDITGRIIAPFDYIVHSVASGRKGFLRYGYVMSTMNGVECYAPTQYSHGKTTSHYRVFSAERSEQTILIVEPSQVPASVIEALEMAGGKKHGNKKSNQGDRTQGNEQEGVRSHVKGQGKGKQRKRKGLLK